MNLVDRLFVSTACLKGDKEHHRVIDTLNNLGIQNVELTGVHPHLPLEKLGDLVRGYEKEGRIFTYHNYFPPPEESFVLNFLTRNEEVRLQSSSLIRSAVGLAKETGVFLFAFHPGYYRDADALPNGHFRFRDEERLTPREAMTRFRKEFSEFYRSLQVESPKQKVFVALENLFPGADGTNDSFMTTFEEIDELFSSPEFRDTNIGLLMDLGHLTISANIQGFSRDTFLENVVRKYGDRIYEVHLSENDGREDLHLRVEKDSWQTQALRHFRNTGSRIGGTRFCIESRGMLAEEIREDHAYVRNLLQTLEARA